MKRLMILSVIVCTLLLVQQGVVTAGDTKDKKMTAAIDTEAPGFTLADADGNERSLKDFKGKYVVLEWTNADCPFVKKHYTSGNMQTLQKEYAKKGVVWLTICSSAQGKDGYYENAAVQKLIKENKSMQTAYLIDADGKVGRMYGAKTTPHMFVIDPKGILIYAGGIDNKKSTNPDDVKGATNYVSECLDAAMSGKPVATKTAAPYGCSVKYKDV